MTEESLFHEALARPPGERAAFLDSACAGKPKLRAAVAALLAAHEASGELLPGTQSDPDATGSTSPGTLAETSAVTPESGSIPTIGGASTRGSAATPDATQGFDAGQMSPPQKTSPATRGESNASTVISGRYVLEERIGEGGMGEVWAARQTEPVKRRVALKLIKPGMDSRAVLQRFEQERQALALMDHPNIAKVFDAGLTPTGQPFFVMELVDGAPLTRFCDELLLTPRQRLELFVPICQAVQHAHQKGIVHRDLKPANILVTLIDNKPVPKVIDFGVAKATAGKLTEDSLSTQFGSLVGTLEYMSPEQAGFSNEDIDTRADIYSLGVILYELLTGLRPIDAKRLKKAALTEMIRVIREEEPSKPSTRLSTEESMPSLAAVRQTDPRRLMNMLRGELDWVVMKCLEKQRDRRYETANGLARDIQRYLADETVEARPPSAGYRLRKFVSRNKGRVVAASLVLIALVAGIIGTSLGMAEARRAAAAEGIAKNDALVQKGVAEQATEKEKLARHQTELALTESLLKTARMTYQRAQSFCEDGQADLGLLWMARSLELTPPGATDLDRVIRTSINLWARELPTIRVSAPWGQLPYSKWSVLSPDGHRLVSAHEDRSTRLWDVDSGRLIFTFPFEKPDPSVRIPPRPRAAYSPDGRRVASTRGDGKVLVWDTVTGRQVAGPPDSESRVSGISFDSQSKLLATSSGNTIRIWNLARKQAEGDSLSVPEESLGVEFSPDGRWIMSWNSSHVFLWDAGARQLVKSLHNDTFPVVHVSFAPDSKHLLLMSYREARFWELEQGRPVGVLMSWVDRGGGPGGDIKSSFRADGKVAVTPGSPPRFWEVPSGRPLGVDASFLIATSPVISRDGKRLYLPPLISSTNFADVLDIGPGMERVPIRPLSDNIQRIVASPDGSTIALFEWVDRKYRCMLIRARTGQLICDPIDMEANFSDTPGPQMFSPDGLLAAVGSGLNGFELRDTSTGALHGGRFETKSIVRAFGFSPDGLLIASGDRDGEVRIWSTSNGQPVGEPMKHELAVRLAQFSPDGDRLLVTGGAPGSLRGFLQLWNRGDRRPLSPVIGNLGEIHDACFSPDGRSFATTSLQFLVRDSSTGKSLWERSPVETGLTTQTGFSPNGKQVLALILDANTVQLFNAQTSKPTGPSLDHSQPIIGARFSPDGYLVLTSSHDHKARLWDSTFGLRVGPAWTNLVRNPIGDFAPDGKGVYLHDDTGLVRWELPPPIEGTPERIRLAIESATRRGLDEFGGLKILMPVFSSESIGTGRVILTPDPFIPIQKRFDELGGPPGFFRR